jgi:hypothetical protein
MQKVVIYPSVGFMGAINVQVATLVEGKAVRAMSLDEVRAKGRTARARYDLAIEVPAFACRGCWLGEVDRRAVPASWFGASEGLSGLAA